MASLIERTLELTGKREQVNGENIKELTANWNLSGEPLLVRLTNKSLDSEAAAYIVDLLSTVEPTVEIADISDVIAGRPTEEGFSVLSLLSSALKRFNLREVNVSDNALGPKGIESCRDILSGKNIERLFVCNNGLSAEAAALLADILLEEGMPPMKLFHFYNNMSGDGGGVALARILSAGQLLEDVRFSATRARAEGCLAIAHAINTIRQLKRLDVSDNNFDYTAVEVLIKSLQDKSQLEYLNLRDDGLGVKGTTFLANTLKSSSFPALTHLDLSGNEIDGKAASKLAEWLSQLTNLKELTLDDNEIGDKGVIAIAGALENMQALETLSINGSEVKSKGAMAIANAVIRLPAFKKLNINENNIASSVVSKIEEMFEESGKVLGDMEDNDGDEDEDDEEDEEDD